MYVNCIKLCIDVLFLVIIVKKQLMTPIFHLFSTINCNIVLLTNYGVNSNINLQIFDVAF